jgi:hypothetical protein
MELALAIITLLNAATPGIAELIVLVKKKDGSVSVLTMLDEADAKFKKNIEQAGEWLKVHKNGPA